MMVVAKGNWRSLVSPSSRVIPAVVGLVLFSAALLKILNPEPGNSFGSLMSVLAVFEVVFAIWLWTGVWPSASRLVASALFSCFAVYNWMQAKAGTLSCACFGSLGGSIGFSPTMVLALDVAIILLLIYWQPLPTSHVRQAYLAAGTLVFCLLAILAISVSDTEGSGTSKTSQGLLEVVPQALDLGRVSQGTCSQAEFVLRNPSSEPVFITEVRTSCPCLQIRLPGTAVPPGGEMKGQAFVDMSREPNVTGKVALKAEGGSAEQKNPAFVIFVTVTVIGTERAEQ